MEKLTQKEAAKIIGISDSYLSKILAGKSIPRPDVLKKLTKMTKSDTDIWLFGNRLKKEQALESLLALNIQPSPSES